MLLFCVGIVHTNMYKCISLVLAKMLYLELFDLLPPHVVVTRMGIRS